MDLKYILEEKLNSDQQPIHSHKSSLEGTGNVTGCGQELRLFSGLQDPAETINRLMTKMYKYDFELFGYSYTIKNGKVIALCNDCCL